MNMSPLKSLATLVVVGIRTETVSLKSSIPLKLRFSEMEEKYYLVKEAIEETINKDKSNQRRRTSKMLLIIIASFTEERLSLEIQDLLGDLLKISMIMLTDMVKNLENMLS